MTRVVLDAATIAFEQGYQAFEAGEHRTENPYSAHTSAALRQSWFEGWDYGKLCGGTCNE